MKVFKLLGGLAVIMIFLVGGLSIAAAAVTKPLEFPEVTAELTPKAGVVELEREGELIWTAVTEPITVYAGDSVRTGEEGEASINLYDQGVMHLAPNSVIVLDTAEWDQSNPDVFNGEINLKAGDLWSRVFNFISPESGFRVRTSSTVATVRGTTFWVGAFPNDTSRVYVEDHVVEVKSLKSSAVLDVTEGEMVRLEKQGERSALRLAPEPAGADLVIIERYRGWDKDYEADLAARRLAFAEQTRKIDPVSRLYGLQNLAERGRLLVAMDDAKRDQLRADFMAGRVLDAYIELARYKDGARANLLLAQAVTIGDAQVAMHPKVRLALQFFDREEGMMPTDLQRIFDEPLEEPTPNAISKPKPTTVPPTPPSAVVPVTTPAVLGTIDEKQEPVKEVQAEPVQPLR